jgi:hypothetical protein
LEKDHAVHIVEMMSLVSKLLGPPEEVATRSPFPNHAHRWMIFQNQHFKVYLHHSANDDFSDGLGSYPKRLISIGFAKSCAKQLADPLKVIVDRAAWMVLIAKSVHGPENIPGA